MLFVYPANFFHPFQFCTVSVITNNKATTTVMTKVKMTKARWLRLNGITAAGMAKYAVASANGEMILTGLSANYSATEYVGMTNHQCKPCGKSTFAGCFADFDQHAEMQLQLLILMERGSSK